MLLFVCGLAFGTDLPATTPGDLRPLEWMVGHWASSKGSETWIPVGEVLFGVSFSGTRKQTAGWEVLELVDIGGQPAYVARPGGAAPVMFPRAGSGQRTVTFANPGHDYPTQLVYTREGDRLEAVVSGPPGGGQAQTFKWTLEPDLPQALDIEKLDRARDRAPARSGLSMAGDLGWTVGMAGREEYATIWEPAPGGVWAVKFDSLAK